MVILQKKKKEILASQPLFPFAVRYQPADGERHLLAVGFSIQMAD